MENHVFRGKWVTDAEFSDLKPRNVFHRQKDTLVLPEEHLDSHILFRGEFDLKNLTRPATIYITADDYYKLYINGRFVAMGPALAYHSRYGYNTVWETVLGAPDFDNAGSLCHGWSAMPVYYYVVCCD